MKRDYREKPVLGVITDGKRMENCTVHVRMTNDDHGAFISLQAFNIMIEIPLESVSDIVTLTTRTQ